MTDDPNVRAVMTRLQLRSQAGLAEYGTTTARPDFNVVDWLRQLQDEALDAAVYIEAIIASDGPRFMCARCSRTFSWADIPGAHCAHTHGCLLRAVRVV